MKKVSMEELGNMFGVKANKGTGVSRMCRECGVKMDEVPGTNIHVCRTCGRTVISGVKNRS